METIERHFLPKLSEDLHLITFAEIAEKYLKELGYEPVLCQTEDEARELAKKLPEEGKWPCLFVKNDTTGEKDFVEFFTDSEVLDMERFENIGVIKNELDLDNEKLENFSLTIQKFKKSLKWDKESIVELFHGMDPNFGHKETGKYLDGKCSL